MMEWETAWRTTLGVSESSPQWWVATIAVVSCYLFVVVPVGAVFSFIERKINADLQGRIGPNRSGPFGLVQPLCDILKLMQKTGSAEKVDRTAVLWFAFVTLALYSTVAVLPLSSLFLLVDTDMSALIPFWSALVLSLGLILLGFGLSDVSGWFGGVRLTAQALSGAFPALISVLVVGIHAGGFRWSRFVAAQADGFWSWSAFASPFHFLAFIIFVVSGMIVMSVPPMDAALSIPDMHGGVFSGVFGRRLGFFRIGRFYGFFFWCVVCVVLFLGAWGLPSWIENQVSGEGRYVLRLILESGVILLKTMFLMLLIGAIGTANPRIRVDQITDFNWRVLGPLSILALVGGTIWKVAGIAW